MRVALLVLFAGVLLMSGWPVGVGGSDGAGEHNGRPLDPQDGVWFEEVVTSPETDWRESGSVTNADEYIVFRNFGASEVDLDGWVLGIYDGSPTSWDLEGTLSAGESYLLQNPYSGRSGSLNNDATLALLNAGGTEVDNVTLGEEGVPQGNAGDGVLEEAVHLAGPWAGNLGPGTGGRGLGPFFVSHFAAAPVIDQVAPFQDAWAAPPQGALAVKIEAAPGFTAEKWDLHMDSKVVPLELVNETTGVWQSDSETVAKDGHVKLTSSGHELDAFPAGHELRIRLDHDPPRLDGLAWPDDEEPVTVLSNPVADAERRIHWFPELITGPSGVVSVIVEATGGVELPGCLPLDAPGPDCIVPEGDDEVVVVVRDGAGREVNETLFVEVWDDAPEVPVFHFLRGPPPWLAWEHGPRVLEEVVVGSAQDVTGAWPVREVTLAGNATGFVDDAWVPGEPRAYRLIVTDLAGNTATGPWVALDPEDVPVQAELQFPEDLVSLALQGEAEVKALFDRPLENPPRIAFQVDASQPLYQEIEGAPVAGQDAYSYLVKLPGPVEEAVASVSLVGGRGVDQAPIDPVELNVTWDHKPPRLEFAGVEPRWVQGTRHVVTVTASDGVDDQPRVLISQVPEHASVEELGASARVTLQGQGLLQVEGHAEDAAGNRAPFVFEVGLDATPPVVHGLETLSEWSSDAPLGFHVEDDASGINASSLQVWVRNESVFFESHVEVDEDGWVEVHLVNTTQAVGPFEVYVAVADRAGNGVEGFLSDRLVPVAMTNPGNGSVSVHTLEDRGPGAGAPVFLGPPWFQEGGEQEGQVVATGGEGSNEGTTSSPWEEFSWDDVEQEEEGRSFGWYLLGLVGLMGLGTAVHQVGRHRKKAQKKGHGKRDEPEPKAPQTTRSDEDDRDEAAGGGAAAEVASDENAGGEAVAPRAHVEADETTSGAPHEPPVVLVASSAQPDNEAPDEKIVHADADPDDVCAITDLFMGIDQSGSAEPLWDVDCDRDPDEGEGSAGWAHVVVNCPPAVEA